MFSLLKVKLLKIGFTSVEVIQGIIYLLLLLGINPNLPAILFYFPDDGNLGPTTCLHVGRFYFQ